MATFNQNLYKAIELHFTKHSTVPSTERLSELTSIPIEQIEEAFDDEDFIQILKASYLYEFYNSAPGDLSLAQLSALHVFANQHDRRTITQKLKALRITSQQFNRWMQDPVFSRTLNSKVQQSFKDNGWRVFQSLLEQAAGGDFNSTKLYMEMNGHYTPSSRAHNTNVNVSTKSIDLLIEVILRVLGPREDGPELINRITKGFEEVLTTGSLKSEILELNSPAKPSLQYNLPTSITSTASITPSPPVGEVVGSGKSKKTDDVLNFLEEVHEEYHDDLGI